MFRLVTKISWDIKTIILSYLSVSEGKESACNTGGPGSITGLGKFPGEGNGNSLQYSCQGIPWTEEPGGLQSMVLQRVRHDWSNLA